LRPLAVAVPGFDATITLVADPPASSRQFADDEIASKSFSCQHFDADTSMEQRDIAQSAAACRTSAFQANP
jgi:hypothetical protein